MTLSDKDDIAAAMEYARRRRKGLPCDRWSDGTDGEHAVARGIDLLAEAVAELWADKINQTRLNVAER